jgi:hypothetical protein
LSVLVRALAEFDRLDAQILRQRRLVFPNLTDHRLGRLRSRKNSTTFSVWALTRPKKSTSRG